ncbi:hypothetical protein AC579_5418 [Pseudocercospora musae]|uniref:Uncharacterized protein n=1 Tax=Pseudocercospora musae TaxID=113226 RepID=A0A139I1L1_9PEZI|nr:hypothetical protein AC579_5418 [Pseudocercospora musae]
MDLTEMLPPSDCEVLRIQSSYQSPHFQIKARDARSLTPRGETIKQTTGQTNAALSDSVQDREDEVDGGPDAIANHTEFHARLVSDNG